MLKCPLFEVASLYMPITSSFPYFATFAHLHDQRPTYMRFFFTKLPLLTAIRGPMRLNSFFPPTFDGIAIEHWE